MPAVRIARLAAPGRGAAAPGPNARAAALWPQRSAVGRGGRLIRRAILLPRLGRRAPRLRGGGRGSRGSARSCGCGRPCFQGRRVGCGARGHGELRGGPEALAVPPAARARACGHNSEGLRFGGEREVALARDADPVVWASGRLVRDSEPGRPRVGRLGAREHLHVLAAPALPRALVHELDHHCVAHVRRLERTGPVHGVGLPGDPLRLGTRRGQVEGLRQGRHVEERRLGAHRWVCRARHLEAVPRPGR
mmetsp:Transcript_22252/g.69464  ORF Transcript_22252/g.69464 Transcript_22252/m.69464 type:complete len:250 (-) Transcript_22252:1620-2369(-)